MEEYINTITCPFNGPDKTTLDQTCLQCRIRPFIDNWYFMIAYLAILVFLYFKTHAVIIAAYIILSTIFVVYAFTCSFSATLFIRAGEAMIFNSGIILVLLYVGSGLYARLFER